MDDLVFSVDAASGERLWEWRGGRPSALTATADHVLVTFEADHRYALLDAATGTLRWEAPIEERRQAWQTIAGDVVVTRETTSLRVQTADDGEVLLEVDLPPTGADGTPAVGGDVVITAVDGGLHGYELADSKRRWSSDVSPTRPVLSWPDAFCPLYGECPNVIVAPEDHRVVALEATTGEELWEYAIPRPVEEVADIGSDLIAVVSRSRVDVLRRTDGEHVYTLATPTMRNLRPGQAGTFFAEVASTVQKWQFERGRIWQLNDGPGTSMSGYTTFVGDEPPEEETIVAPLSDGTTLAAFHTSAVSDDGWQLPYSCDGLRPSWSLGDLDAWEGDGVKAALLYARGGPQQLWIGIPGADPASEFTLTARPLDGSGTAAFSRFDDTWTETLEVRHGGRIATNFPPHWVVAARFSKTGCWELHVKGDDLDQTVVIPVTTPGP